MSKRPAFQFYPSDWRNEAGLRMCSMGARGLWVEMMCLMHEGEPYGHLTHLGRSLDAQMLARICGENPRNIKSQMKELEENCVFSRTHDGTIFSRRMVRDENIRERRANGGNAGAEHGKKGAEHGKKGGRPASEKPPLKTALELNEGGLSKPPLKPPPSSSSSYKSINNNHCTTDSANEGLKDDGSPEPAKPKQQPPNIQAVLDAAEMAELPKGGREMIEAWRDAGATLDYHILPAITETLKDMRNRGKSVPFSLKFYDRAVRDRLATDAADVERWRDGSKRMDEARLAGEADDRARFTADLAWVDEWAGEPADTAGRPSDDRLEAVRAAAQTWLDAHPERAAA